MPNRLRNPFKRTKSTRSTATDNSSIFSTDSSTPLYKPGHAIDPSKQRIPAGGYISDSEDEEKWSASDLSIQNPSTKSSGDNTEAAGGQKSVGLGAASRLADNLSFMRNVVLSRSKFSTTKLPSGGSVTRFASNAPEVVNKWTSPPIVTGTETNYSTLSVQYGLHRLWQQRREDFAEADWIEGWSIIHSHRNPSKRSQMCDAAREERSGVDQRTLYQKWASLREEMRNLMEYGAVGE
ncbi:hypothetical protein I302_106367 [Kwoniella bestiolae CBS 10118]|uniref:Uncharacterized protein n=1 Tax=Kwoniella bestiolae CBS 10118 TaxID=1296100 RepID=A0A1B9G3S8_9TREE|nr:hypothetical protein I302_05490 [Kwoniella bestiolae CBS 10118]OCF25666.1 hypothetical protein I302_05490 [Kwoniella bestiolae CBS 10118]